MKPETLIGWLKSQNIYHREEFDLTHMKRLWNYLDECYQRDIHADGEEQSTKDINHRKFIHNRIFAAMAKYETNMTAEAGPARVRLIEAMSMGSIPHLKIVY